MANVSEVVNRSIEDIFAGCLNACPSSMNCHDLFYDVGFHEARVPWTETPKTIIE